MEEVYDESKESIRSFLQDKPHVFQYLDSHVLIHREKFVVAWTRKWLHLGNVATSRVEGAHAVMKRWIGSSTADILTVFEMVEKSIISQENAIDVGPAQDRIFTSLFANEDLFANLVRRVSRHATALLVEQYRRLKRVTKEKSLLTCTKTFTGTMGLAFSHRIAKILASPVVLNSQHSRSFSIQHAPRAYSEATGASRASHSYPLSPRVGVRLPSMGSNSRAYAKLNAGWENLMVHNTRMRYIRRILSRSE